MEDVVDAGASRKINGGILDEATFEFIGVRVDKEVDEMEHKWAAIDICNWVTCHSGDLSSRKLVFFLRQCDLNLLVQQGDRFLDVVDQDSVERFGEERDTHLVSKISIHTVRREVFFFGHDCISDTHIVDDVLLRAAFDTVVSQLERINRAIEELERVCALIHQINLCEHANCALALRVHLFRDLERVRIRKVYVRR